MARSAKEKGNRHDVDERAIGKYIISVTVMLTGVEAHRVRRFEAVGFFKPVRTAARQRLYCDYELELIKEIAKLEDEGINLQGVKVILAMRRGERE